MARRRGGGGGRPPVPSGGSGGRLSPNTVTVAALLAGVAVGRFLIVQPEPTPAPPRPQAQTLSAEIAALEQRVEGNPSDIRGWQRLGGSYVLQAGATGDPATATSQSGRSPARAACPR